MEAAGVEGRPDLCYFVDDSKENVRVAREVIGWTAFLFEESGFQDDTLDYDFISSSFGSNFPEIYSPLERKDGVCGKISGFSGYVSPKTQSSNILDRDAGTNSKDDTWRHTFTIKTLDEIATHVPHLFT
jgi:hypothetical protein